MAQAAAKTIECGFCCRRNEDLEKPKALPCRHVHCFGCLTAFFEINHMTRCPVTGCGEVVDVPLDTLSSHDMDKDNNKWCDVCIDKRLGNKPAVIYCTNCEKKYCIKHEESHDDLIKGHKKKPVSEYDPKSSNLQERECLEHEDQMYSLGCRNCLTLICVKCVPDLTTCADGKQHKLMTLDKLVADLAEDDVRVQMTAKEEKLEKLFKVTSKVSSEYDVKTAEMIQLLRDTRDGQLKEIREKYDKLEEELIEKRQKKRLELAEYLEHEVLTKWTQLRNQIHKIETKLKHSHQVDMVKGFSELNIQLQKLVDEELPKLEMTGLVDVSKKEESRSIELQMISSDDMYIDSELGVHSPVRLPKSLQHLRSVQLSSYIPSISQYKGDIYVVLSDKGVAKVDSNNQLNESFITCSERIDCIVVHEDRVYVLLPSGTSVVRVYDMLGRQVTQWNVTCCSGYLHNAMAVVSVQLVITDHPNKRLSVYSLSGQLQRYIPCTLLGDVNHRFMSAVDDFSVVISVYDTKQVSRVNVGTGEVMWTCNLPTNPGSVTCYSRQYALVASYCENKISTVDNKTGKIVAEMAAEAMGGHCVFGLQAFGDTLVVANYSTCKLVLFKMNF